MAITAYLEAARVLRNDVARSFALLTLRRLLAEAWSGEDLLSFGTSSRPANSTFAICQ